MNIFETIKSEEFKDMNQFQRKKLFNNFILQDKDCKIGAKVICFQHEILISEKNKWSYKQYGSKRKKIKTVTIGNFYEILKIKDGKISILNDIGHKTWFTTDRFLYSIKMERKEKLKKIGS
jgi:hypothetical protein